jgi:hypothetical protein
MDMDYYLCMFFSLSQFVGWYDDKSLGGLESCLNQMIESDPNFGKSQNSMHMKES